LFDHSGDPHAISPGNDSGEEPNFFRATMDIWAKRSPIEIFPLNSSHGETKIPLSLMNRFKQASIPAIEVLVLLIVHPSYGPDSPRGFEKTPENEHA
jgi:hypothetical protein